MDEKPKLEEAQVIISEWWSRGFNPGLWDSVIPALHTVRSWTVVPTLHLAGTRALCHVALWFLPQNMEGTSLPLDFGLSHVTWFGQHDMCRYDTNIGPEYAAQWPFPLAILWLPRKEHALASLLDPRGGKRPVEWSHSSQPASLWANTQCWLYATEILGLFAKQW